MKNEKNTNIFLNLVSNDENYMDSLIENIQMLRTHYGWSVRVLSEKADIPYDPLQTFLKGKAKDCNLSKIVKLAKVFNVSIDELIGCGTIEPETKQVIAMGRSLDEHVRKVIKVYAKHQYFIHQNRNAEAKKISVITPECIDRRLKRTSLGDEVVELNKLTRGTQEKVSFGIKIPCDHYEPYFLKDEIVLLGYDREGENNETCVISSHGYIYICKKKIQFVNGKKEINYIAITNKKKIFSWDEIDDRFGYVVGFLHPNGELGIR